MVRARVYGILAGYADQNDHDTLRADPVFKLIADRSPDDDDLASQPTLSRFENAISIKSLKRLRDVFLDQFIASFDTPPRHLVFDLDAVDDPAHGHQQLTFWHGYYDQNQYLPLVITCADLAENVPVILARLGQVSGLSAGCRVGYPTPTSVCNDRRNKALRQDYCCVSGDRALPGPRVRRSRLEVVNVGNANPGRRAGVRGGRQPGQEVPWPPGPRHGEGRLVRLAHGAGSLSPAPGQNFLWKMCSRFDPTSK
jgi:hypothetical protein